MDQVYVINRRSVEVALFISLLLHVGFVYHLVFEKEVFNVVWNKIVDDKQGRDAANYHIQDNAVQQWGSTQGMNIPYAQVLFRDEPDEEEQAYIPGQDGTDFFDKKNQALANQNEESYEPQQEQQENDQHEVTPVNNSLLPARLVMERNNPVIKEKKREPRSFFENLCSPKKKSITIPSSGKPLVMPKKSLSLAQLAKGVLDHSAHSFSRHTVTILGQDGGAICAEQIKMERYLQKIQMSVNNAFTIHLSKIPMNAQRLNDAVIIAFIINKDGIIQSIETERTSGSKLIDNFCLSLVRDAGNSFPPIPDYLKLDRLSISYRIYL